MTRFSYLDGREVEADSAVTLFDRLRQTEYVPPASVDRYLDLIRSRASLGFGIRVDVGETGEELEARCRRALASLLNHGWIRRRPRRTS